MKILSTDIEARVFCNASKSGGLYIGVRIDFPHLVIYRSGDVSSSWAFSIGLIFWTVIVDFRGRVREKITKWHDEKFPEF